MTNRVVAGRLVAARGLAWMVVAGVALAISWWSLYGLARHHGLPIVLAAGMSLVFDGAALICVGLAHRYAGSEFSGAGTRLTLLALLAGSIYLNWQRAALDDHTLAAKIIFAGPAVVAIVLVELELGWVHRAGRAARGRVAAPLPVLGRWAWVFHPARSLRTWWLVTAARVDAVRVLEVHRWHQLAAQVPTDPVTHNPGSGPAATEVTGVTAPALVLVTAAAGADQPPGHPDPVTPVTAPATGVDGPGPVHRPVGTGAPLPAGVTVAGLLAGLSTDAERVRFALRKLGGDATTQTIGAYLAAHGCAVHRETIRTAVRRARAPRNGAAVLTGGVTG